MNQNAVVAIPVGSGAFNLRQGEVEVLRGRTPIATRREAEGAGSPDTRTDAVLVACACAGERDAFETLVARYQDRVYTIVHGFVRDPDDALDLVQETFVKAYQGLKSFRGGSSFYTWLYRIAVNNSKDFLRKRAARPAVSLEDELLQEVGFEPAAVDPSCDPVSTATKKELRSVVREAVELLPEKLRLAIILHDIQGLPQQEVAAILDCPLGTAKSHVFRGRARLRKLLGRYIEGGD